MLTTNNRIGRLIPFLIAAFTFIIFLPTLKCGFVNWDDLPNLLNNPHYRGFSTEHLKWMFTTFHLGPYQPLSWLTFAMDHAVWGMNPFGYHLTNVVLHSISALLFYCLCVKLLTPAASSSLPERGTDIRIAAGFAALLFAVHPLRVESVVWVTERRDVLSGAFYLLALLWYVSARSSEREELPYWRRQLLPLAAFLLSLLSKGMAVSLPIALIVLDIYPLKRLPGDPKLWSSPDARRIWAEKVPYFILAALFGAIGCAGQAKAGALASYQLFGFAPRAAQAALSAWFYVWKTLVPLSLSPAYRFPEGPALLNWTSLSAGAAIAAITLALIAARRRWPAALAVWTCYLAALAPVAGFVKFGFRSIADHYSYIPCLGFAALAGAGSLAVLRSANKPLRRAWLLLACLIITCLAYLTWRQEKIWRDSEALWEHALRLDPDSSFAHNNLGLALTELGKTDLAARHYQEAVRLDPANAGARNNLGIALNHQGRREEAILQYREALKIDPLDSEVHYNLAYDLLEHSKPEEAAAHFRAALRINPDFSQAHNYLGEILAVQGKFDEAGEHFFKALTISPNYARAHYNLSRIMAVRVRQERTPEHGKAPKK